MKSERQAGNEHAVRRQREHSHFRPDSGQSIVELALLTPLFLLLVVGAIEVGRYATRAIELGNAARAGAAYGARDHFAAADLPGITGAACQDFQGGNTCDLTITKAYLCQCDNSGTVDPAGIDCTTGSCPAPDREVVSLQVTAQGTFTALFTYPGIPSPITISKTATMRIWK